MNKDNVIPQLHRNAPEDQPGNPSWTPDWSRNDTPGQRSGPHFASILPIDKLSRVDCLHVIPALNSALPVRVYAAPPLTHFPLSLFPYLFTTAQARTVSAGTVVVDPEANGREYLAVLEGELEVQRETITASGADEIQFGRLMKSAGTKAIVLMHTIPRRSCVRAVTAARILQLDSMRVEALLDWIRRGDARRKPVKVRHR